MERHMENKPINQTRKESSEDMNPADTSSQTPRIQNCVRTYLPLGKPPSLSTLLGQSLKMIILRVGPLAPPVHRHGHKKRVGGQDPLMLGYITNDQQLAQVLWEPSAEST